MEEMLPTNPNCIESEIHDDNCNNNHDGDKVGGKEQVLDDLKGSE